MKKVIFILSIGLLVACNTTNDKQTTTDSSQIKAIDTTATFSPIDSTTDFLDTFSTNLKPWLEQTTKQANVRLHDFKYADNWVEDSLVITTQNMNGDFLKTYESVLVYSPDRKKILDLGSYGTVVTKTKNGTASAVNGEPDTEVGIIDIAAKKRRRIFYGGPGSSVETGFWMNDSTVVLAGKNQEQKSSIPMIWMIQLGNKSNFIKRYEYSIH